MAEELYGLTQSDRDVVKAIVREVLWEKGNLFRTHHDTAEQYLTPEVYVAKAPAGGIPKLIGAWDDIDQGTGTGTNPLFFDQPGFAQNVQCYRAVLQTNSKGSYYDLQPISGLVKTVLNLSRTAVPGDSWILIERDKFGDWYVTDVLGSGSGCMNQVQVLQSVSFDPNSCAIVGTLVTVCAP